MDELPQIHCNPLETVSQLLLCSNHQDLAAKRRAQVDLHRHTQRETETLTLAGPYIDIYMASIFYKPAQLTLTSF